jgi:hypothetical protein
VKSFLGIQSYASLLMSTLYTILDKIRGEIIRKELAISGIHEVSTKPKNGLTILKEWITLDSRNTPSTTNLEEEEIVGTAEIDGNASML